MRHRLAVWALISAISTVAAAQTEPAESAPHDPIRTAPQLPPWPTGLSGPREALGETCLPTDLAEATHARLRACLTLPGRCQNRIDTIEQICLARIHGAANVERADCLAGTVESERWSQLELVLIAGGVGLGGILLGLVAGAILAER